LNKTVLFALLTLKVYTLALFSTIDGPVLEFYM